MQKIKEPKVGVVILTRSREGVLKECLKSLKNNTYKNKKIVIIDDAKQEGYAKGNNAGIIRLLRQKCEYILLINDDTVSSPDLISKLVDTFRIDPSIGIVGPTIAYFNKPQIIWYSGGSFNQIFCFTTHPNMNKNVVYARTGYTDFTTGCCMMVRKSVFKDIGLLDRRFGYYFEDAFFCKRALEKGYKSFVIKDVLIKHRVSSTLGNTGSNSMTSLRSYYFSRNPFIIIRDENKYILKFTQLLGQFLIRLPYYTAIILSSGQLRSMKWYLMGLRDGFWYFLGRRLPKHQGKKIK